METERLRRVTVRTRLAVVVVIPVLIGWVGWVRGRMGVRVWGAAIVSGLGAAAKAANRKSLWRCARAATAPAT